MVPMLFTVAGGELDLSVSPLGISEVAGTSSGTTSPATVTATGGTTPYTYAWTKVSGSTEMGITSASSASTTFSYSFRTQGLFSATFKCTVTDNAGFEEEITIGVTLIYIGGI